GAAHQLLRIADEADIWPTIINTTTSPSPWAEPDESPHQAKPWHCTSETVDVRSPAAPIPRSGATDIT
ncbi:MAG TPA: hypothetical protein VHR39_19280, partial [Propionibacteriaceae bacterium]|nr:hypothetical protein [Propionibacteriaceae bacterium]